MTLKFKNRGKGKFLNYRGIAVIPTIARLYMKNLILDLKEASEGKIVDKPEFVHSPYICIPY